MTWNLDAERDFYRHRCLDSFETFFRYAWGYDINPKGGGGHHDWFQERTHGEACRWFEGHVKEWVADRKAGRGKAKRLICVVPRDWGKTTLFAQAGQAWMHLYDPELASYVGCETLKRVREVLDGIKAVLDGDDPYSRFAWLYGKQRSPKRRWKVDGVVTAARTNLTRRDDSFGTWVVQGGMVGLHPDAGFFDDPNTYERMDRHADWLDIVWSHMSTLIPVFQQDAFLMLTATRYGEGDHIGKAVSRGGVRSMSGMPMPDCEIDPDGVWDVFYLDAIDDKTGALTMPQIWPADRIKQFERENSVRYWAQVRNRPTQNPHNILSRNIVERLLCSPEVIEPKQLRVTFHLDTAFKNPKRRVRGDFNVISAVGHQKQTGRVIYLGALMEREMDSDTYLKSLIARVQDWRAKGAYVACITDEQDIGGKPGIWAALVETKFREAGVRMPELVILDRDSKRKEDRLVHAAGFWRDQKIMLPRTAENVDILIDQMCKIGMSEYQDLADATADCWNQQVYRIVWETKAAEKLQAVSNPFDDILKPGPLGDRAAEKIAAMYAAAEAATADARFDVVQPD